VALFAMEQPVSSQLLFDVPIRLLLPMLASMLL
jgi:hypothetical protein